MSTTCQRLHLGLEKGLGFSEWYTKSFAVAHLNLVTLQNVLLTVFAQLFHNFISRLNISYDSFYKTPKNFEFV